MQLLYLERTIALPARLPLLEGAAMGRDMGESQLPPDGGALHSAIPSCQTGRWRWAGWSGEAWRSSRITGSMVRGGPPVEAFWGLSADQSLRGMA